MARRAFALLITAHTALFVGAVIALAATGTLGRTTLITATASLGAALIISTGLAFLILRPLPRLIAASRRIARGDLRSHVDIAGSIATRELTGAFNEMTRSVEELVDEAARERNRLTAVLNSNVDAVVALDQDGRITFANAAAEQLFGRARDLLVDRPFAWALADEEAVEAVRQSHEEGRPSSCTIEREGRQYLEVLAAPIVEGGEWSALVVCRDVTGVRRTEQIRRDFVANVSHELRTPLASIKSVIETLEGGALEDTDAAREFLTRADEEVDRLVRMVEELLELSHIESGTVPLARERVELGDVVENAVERLRSQAQRRQIDLSLAVEPGLPAVIGDVERLERVAVNLIQNALKFTPPGGSVRVSAAAADGAVTVAIADTGAGIRRQDLTRVFERFFKADRARGGASTGLGLAIVKHTVEAHGGAVHVESEEGHGSVFTFSIPEAPVATPR